MKKMAKLFLGLALLALCSAKVFEADIVTNKGDFVYITKFAFDPGCQNECSLELEWNSTIANAPGSIGVYDDNSWAQINSLGSCAEKFNASQGLASTVLIPYNAEGKQTLVVQESYEHWWYVVVIDCDSAIDLSVTLTFTNHGSQFGFNEKGMLPLYAAFFVIQAIMLISLIFVKKFSFLSNAVSSFVAVSLMIECAGMLLAVLHWATYSVSGTGIVQQGNWLEELSTCVLLAGVLYGSAGWSAASINNLGRFSKHIFIGLLAVISSLYIILIIWAIIERNSWWFTDYAYESVPGTIVMVFRLVIGVWFIFNISSTMRSEHNPDKRKVYLQFCIVSFIWIWIVPIFSFLGYSISSFYQLRVESALFLICDTFAFAALLIILRPSVVNTHFTSAGIIGTALSVEATPRLKEEFLGSKEDDERL